MEISTLIETDGVARFYVTVPANYKGAGRVQRGIRIKVYERFQGPNDNVWEYGDAAQAASALGVHRDDPNRFELFRSENELRASDLFLHSGMRFGVIDVRPRN